MHFSRLSLVIITEIWSWSGCGLAETWSRVLVVITEIWSRWSNRERCILPHVLPDDFCWNASAFADLVTTQPGPVSNLRATLSAWSGTSPPPPICGLSLTGTLDIRPQYSTELLRITRTEINFVLNTIEYKADSFIGFRAVEIVYKKYLYLLGHSSFSGRMERDKT